MAVVAIIPARGGSKGVPGKNLRPVGGVPLVVRAINSALASTLVDRVIVSTDDDAIASTARDAGAEVSLRPDDISGDTATSESALFDVLDRIGDPNTLEADPEVVVFIQATSPFIDPARLDDAIARVQGGGEDVVFSAVETYAFLWKPTTGSAVGVNHDASFRPRRQDREPHYRETGAFYVMRTAGFRKAGFRFFGRIGFAEVADIHSLEIDSVEELEMADALAPLAGATLPHTAHFRQRAADPAPHAISTTPKKEQSWPL